MSANLICPWFLILSMYMFVEIKTFKNRSNDICEQMFHLQTNKTKGHYQ